MRDSIDVGKGWLKAWERFNNLYHPHNEELQSLIQHYAEEFELAYNDLDDIAEQESFIGMCYMWAKKYGLPMSLIDWWRILQVYWVLDNDTDNFSSYPDMLPIQGNRYIKYQRMTLQAFRIALSDEEEIETMFLAAMLEAIRASEAQHILWNGPKS